MLPSSRALRPCRPWPCWATTAGGQSASRTCWAAAWSTGGAMRLRSAWGGRAS
jgi:hypothetical protein